MSSSTNITVRSISEDWKLKFEMSGESSITNDPLLPQGSSIYICQVVLIRIYSGRWSKEEKCVSY